MLRCIDFEVTAPGLDFGSAIERFMSCLNFPSPRQGLRYILKSPRVCIICRPKDDCTCRTRRWWLVGEMLHVGLQPLG